MRISPSGGLPVAIIKGRIMSESNDIMEEIERQFPSNFPLLAPAGSADRKRHDSLMKLEVMK
jgi:glutathione S-transferase